MPKLNKTEISCGIVQLSGLCRNPDIYDSNDRIPPEEVLLEAFEKNDSIRNRDWGPWGMVIFSDSVRRGNGRRLASFIRKNNLGKVQSSKIFNNPNTYRAIQIWLWYIDRSALVKWIRSRIKNSDPLAYAPELPRRP